MPPRINPLGSIEDIIGIFGQYDAEVARALQLHPSTVRNWKRFRKIGRENWDLLTLEGAKRGHTIDANLLHRLCLYSGQAGTRKRGRPPAVKTPSQEGASTS